MSGELKACPFDGADARLIRHGDTKRFSIRCCKCGADVGECDTEAEVREHWNTRPTPAPGALPELPAWMDCYTIPNDAFDGGDDVYLSDRIRSYAEQCRAGVVVTESMVERALVAFPASETYPGYYPHMMDPHDREHSAKKMRAALQSAFADDEGVK